MRIEQFELTDKDGSVAIVDKEIRNGRHRDNYIALMERHGYKVRQVNDDHDARNVRAYVQAQEDAMYDRFCQMNNI
jgi:hypothetical protein